MDRKRRVYLPFTIILITLVGAVLVGLFYHYEYEKKYQYAETFESIQQVDTALTDLNFLIQIMNENLSGRDTTIPLLGTKENEIAIYLESYIKQIDNEEKVEVQKQIENKIEALRLIINMEHVNIFSQMSLDARTPAMKLLADISKLYGLEVAFDLQGNIVKISDITGTALYSNEIANANKNIRLEKLVITMLILTVFVSICIYITKKKQIFIKDGIYDGYNQEGFA